MLRDPLITYASKLEEVSAELLELAESKHSDTASEDVFQHYVAAANLGSAFAMCLCSRLSFSGWGTSQSSESAYLWAKRAADSGFAPGFYEFAHCYEQGIGVSRDMRMAEKFYELSINAGFGFAGHRLGEAFYKGDFGVVDINRAVRYMERAQQLGESSGAMSLAQWYESGEKLRTDTATALRWYERASELGDPFGTFRLHLAYQGGELDVERDLALAQRYHDLFEKQIS